MAFRARYQSSFQLNIVGRPTAITAVIPAAAPPDTVCFCTIICTQIIKRRVIGCTIDSVWATAQLQEAIDLVVPYPQSPQSAQQITRRPSKIDSLVTLDADREILARKSTR